MLLLSAGSGQSITAHQLSLSRLLQSIGSNRAQISVFFRRFFGLFRYASPQVCSVRDGCRSSGGAKESRSDEIS
jgi:hypothetical protein